MAIYGSADDSVAALIYYRLRSRQMGGYTVTTGWTAIDTLGPVGDGTMATTTGAAVRVGAIALTTLLGYSEIQFFVDYLTGTSNAAADGSANTVRFYYFYVKPDAIAPVGK
jgi:hypothetical protein